MTYVTQSYTETLHQTRPCVNPMCCLCAGLQAWHKIWLNKWKHWRVAKVAFSAFFPDQIVFLPDCSNFPQFSQLVAACCHGICYNLLLSKSGETNEPTNICLQLPGVCYQELHAVVFHEDTPSAQKPSKASSEVGGEEDRGWGRLRHVLCNGIGGWGGGGGAINI